MAVQFKITVRSEGTSHQQPYVGKDGKKVADLMIGAVEGKVLDLTGRMIAKVGLEASERVLWYAAIYFQRLISRTPRDENYSYEDEKGRIHHHKGESNPDANNDYDKNNDHIQDFWTARYWNYEGITAKYLRENCGCDFETFNNPKEIEVIYKEFRNRFFGKEGSRGRANKESGKTTLKGIRFYCDFPKDKYHELRYHLLEYGGYVGDGIIKQGSKYYHGVAEGRSIQAPKGMTALTDAEYQSGQFKAPSKRAYTKNLLKYSGPTQQMTKELEKIIGTRSRLSDSDIAKIMELYGA